MDALNHINKLNDTLNKCTQDLLYHMNEVTFTHVHILLIQEHVCTHETDTETLKQHTKTLDTQTHTHIDTHTHTIPAAAICLRR